MKMTLQNPDEIKIFILFLLEKIGYPLSFTDLGTIVIRDGIVDYFGYFEYFSELVEAGHIAVADENGEPTLNPGRKLKEDRENNDFADDQTSGKKKSSKPLSPTDYIYPRPTAEEINDPTVKYVATKTGLLIARALSEDILMAAVREKSYMSAMRHLSLEKRGAVTDQTFTHDGKGYIFKCSVKDKDGLTMELSIRADTVYQLNRMRLNFDEKPDVIVRGMLSLLTGNVDYLFEEDDWRDSASSDA